MIDQCFECGEEMVDCECGETEGYSDHGAVCPYCGHVDLASESEGYIYDESHDMNTCPGCGKDYRMSLYISHTWTTHRI